jgi:hypothetical protein
MIKQKQTRKHKNNKNYKNHKNYKNTKKQNGSGVFNSMAGLVFTNTKKRNMTVHIPGSKLIKTYKQQIKNLQLNNKNKYKNQNLLKIIYNYRTPKQFIVNENLNNLFESSYVLAVPHIQIYDIKYYLLVLILPGIKPKLLWAIELNNGSKLKTIINYLLPKQPIDQKYKLLFKLYKYPDNSVNPFKLKDSMLINRKKAYRKLQKYLIKYNMENRLILTEEISVIQDKGSGIDNIISKLLINKI